ncbi:MAG: hypothetical protein ACRDGL_10020 [Candidatus Limnocylindrales bacterium]
MNPKRDPSHGTQESLDRRAREYDLPEEDDTEGQGISPAPNEDSDALGPRPLSDDEDDHTAALGPDA